MSDEINYDEWLHVREDDPPPDLTREENAYAREEERLLRDHLGKIALIRKDDVLGVFDTPGEAIAEGIRRFGRVRFLAKLIEEREGPIFMPLVDINHPSFRRTDGGR